MGMRKVDFVLTDVLRWGGRPLGMRQSNISEEERSISTSSTAVTLSSIMRALADCRPLRIAPQQ